MPLFFYFIMKDLKNKLQKFLQQVPHDKLLHFFYGSLLAFLFTIIFNTFVSFILVSLIAGTKEIFDGSYSFTDVLVTVLPALLILLIQL